jgi:hypothetical protein
MTQRSYDVHNCTHDSTPPCRMHTHSITTCLRQEAWENGTDVFNNFYFLRYEYSKITFTKSPSFCITTFRASLTYLTALLPQSHDSSCYVSRPMLALPPLWLQKHTDLRAHDIAHSPDLWHQPRLTNVTCAWSWRLCGINSAIECSLVQRGVRGQWSWRVGQNCVGQTSCGKNEDSYGQPPPSPPPKKNPLKYIHFWTVLV